MNEQMVCAECGHEKRKNNRYCTECGKRLDTRPRALGRLIIVSEAGTEPDSRRRVQQNNITNERRSGFDISQFPLKIGRSDDNTLVMIDEQSSAYHALITTDGLQFWIQDLESTNGTHIDGIRIDATTQLRADSLIKIGSTIIKFEHFPETAA